MAQWKSCPSGLINMQRKNILTRATRVHSQREKEKKKEKDREYCGEKNLQTIYMYIFSKSNNLQYTVGKWVYEAVVPASDASMFILID